MKSTFYVNMVRGVPSDDWNHQCIGLFSNNEHIGKGYFCGWYGAEFYLNTTLIAYGIQKRNGSKPYNAKASFDGGFKVVNRQYDEIMIGSELWESEFNADSVNEAIEIFKSQSW